MSDETEPESKTQRKKAMQELQTLGEELVSLSNEQLSYFNLPEALYDAVREAKRLTKHEAIRRQGQFIGRLMRDVDVESIREHLDRIKGKSAQLIAHHHRLERWRELLLDDETALERFALEYPGCDIQQLRQLIRNARRERDEMKTPRAFRQIFQVLKETIPTPTTETPAQ